MSAAAAGAVGDLEQRLRETLQASYAIEREIGGGGMSRVFVADERRLGRKVVIKVLSPELAQGISIERFEREIRMAASLQHPHIVGVLDLWKSADPELQPMVKRARDALAALGDVAATASLPRNPR